MVDISGRRFALCVTLCLALFGGLAYAVYQQEATYRRDTSPEVQEQHQQLARELRNSYRGTLFEATDDRFFVVCSVGSGSSDDQEIYFSRGPGDVHNKCMYAYLLARTTKRRIPDDTAEYDAAAKAYLKQEP